MLELAVAVALMVGTWAALRGGFRGPRGFQLAGFDLNALGLAVAAVAAAMYFWGVLFGLALMVAVVIHEFGHVAAFRVCGHADARFRLVPLMGGVAISGQQPASANHALFITLMGPAICLAPMVLCFALFNVLSQTESIVGLELANFLYIQGLVLGALNFFNLLPLWPLDGGKIAQRLVFTFAPDMTRTVSMGMMVLAVALCVLSRSFFLLFFVLMSWPGLVQSEQLLRAQRGTTKRTAWLALAAYLATTACFFLAGAPMLMGFF